MLLLLMEYTLFSAQAFFNIVIQLFNSQFLTFSHWSYDSFPYNVFSIQYTQSFCKQMDYQDLGLSLRVTLLPSQMMLKLIIECEVLKLF